jgi:hypothetical protein
VRGPRPPTDAPTPYDRNDISLAPGDEERQRLTQGNTTEALALRQRTRGLEARRAAMRSGRRRAPRAIGSWGAGAARSRIARYAGRRPWRSSCIPRRLITSITSSTDLTYRSPRRPAEAVRRRRLRRNREIRPSHNRGIARSTSLKAHGRVFAPASRGQRDQRLVCQNAISPPAGVVTTLRHPAGPSRGASITDAPSATACAVAAAIDSTST